MPRFHLARNRVQSATFAEFYQHVDFGGVVTSRARGILVGALVAPVRVVIGRYVGSVAYDKVRVD
jgi:adenine/guanine phosphoribosyltransferase-like PRPP-binding protein